MLKYWPTCLRAYSNKFIGTSSIKTNQSFAKEKMILKVLFNSSNPLIILSGTSFFACTVQVRRNAGSWLSGCQLKQYNKCLGKWQCLPVGYTKRGFPGRINWARRPTLNMGKKERSVSLLALSLLPNHCDVSCHTRHVCGQKTLKLWAQLDIPSLKLSLFGIFLREESHN